MPGPEHMQEITAMVDAIAEALDIDPTEAATEIEKQAISLSFEEDDTGARIIIAQYQGEQVRVTAAAIEAARQRRASSE